MPKIYKYQKVTDQYTTYIACDNDEEDGKITELCTIDRDTYISVPDDLVLPKQPEQIELKPVTMTEELQGQIEEKSSHIQLIKKRIREKIREKYSIENELKIIRNKINGIDVEEYAKYNSYVEDCIIEGEIKIEKIIKLESSIEK